MNLKEQNKLLNDLVKENDNATIADFMEALKEIEGIAMFACEPLPDVIALREIKKKIVYKNIYKKSA